MFTLICAFNALSLSRLNRVTVMPSTEYFGIFGSNPKYIIAAKMPIMVTSSIRTKSIQHKSRQQQPLFFGGLEYWTGMVRRYGKGSTGLGLSDLDEPVGTNGAVGLFCDSRSMLAG
ncbi:hypothetical protein HanRHA438_Chr07g0303641 [Helianthus annuus]|uniref:Uncharacterized protein n=1 Tax=Helianthus annuus TaxID=4232 RepID=A0A9K3IK81_HELAN|nr:hypothetical protein HanXRQr2_Chr07g0293191 [Helianthus annuus]KAJ0556647.1 hypothetical protein HanIR_Chr07g0316221 [Helianthus annuus]KAJ0904579.1 hypothetical protein HanPSC8_Chr07g0283891 [Helianthus annuus]KAJ0907835.1 hypothetical protein HanRHA438_Chr07g0303641 [Helianthus annuus]